MVRDFRPHSSKWMKGVVIQQPGPITYTVEVDGKLLKRHNDHLRPGIESVNPPNSLVDDHAIKDNFKYSESSPVSSEEANRVESDMEATSQRYPRRDRRPPDRLTF